MIAHCAQCERTPSRKLLQSLFSTGAGSADSGTGDDTGGFSTTFTRSQGEVSDALVAAGTFTGSASLSRDESNNQATTKAGVQQGNKIADVTSNGGGVVSADGPNTLVTSASIKGFSGDASSEAETSTSGTSPPGTSTFTSTSSLGTSISGLFARDVSFSQAASATAGGPGDCESAVSGGQTTNFGFSPSEGFTYSIGGTGTQTGGCGGSLFTGSASAVVANP